MISRRNILIGAASFAAAGVPHARAEAPILTDDGLYKESWFLESFLVGQGPAVRRALAQGQL